MLVSMSWALIRRRSPARRRLPVSTMEAFSCWPICAGVTTLSRKASTVGREKIVQAADLRQLRDDVLGDAVAEVDVLLRAAQVLEVQHRDRRFCDASVPPPDVGELGRAPGARIEVALEPHQVGLQVGRRLVAEVAVLLQRLAEDPAELRGQRRIGLHDRLRVAIQDRVEDDRRRLAREGQRAGRHLVEQRPEREDVGSRVGDLAARLLRRHVGNGAEHDARMAVSGVGGHRLLVARRRSADRSSRDRSRGS